MTINIQFLIFTFLALVIGTMIGVIIGGIIVFVFYLYENKKTQDENNKKLNKLQQEINEIKIKHRNEIDKARKESVDLSRNTLKGKMAEQMAPLLPGFNFLPADSRFLGDPVDYVVFNGYSKLRDANGSADDLEIVILEIKHNNADLSSSQRAIATAINDGRVRFDVVRVFDDGRVEPYTWKPRSLKKMEVVAE